MNIAYPSIPLRRLPTMLCIAFCGALIAGAYGALHDQISYAISPEYFTRMKFRQFAWADAGWPPRAFASVVGFLATWWVGLFAGWFMARAGLDLIPPPERRRVAIRGFAIVLVWGAAAGGLGALAGYIASRADLSGWEHWRAELSLHDLRGFVIVAWLHGAGYVGGLVGLIAAVIYVRRRWRTLASEARREVQL